MKELKYILFIAWAVILLNACSPAEGNFPGSEYMPDMGHSIAYEANVYNYYDFNTWDKESTVELKKLSNPFLPVDGTVPRGYAGIYFADSRSDKAAVMDYLRGEGDINNIAVPLNGNVPYYYEDSDTGRAMATAELIGNPFPITAEGLEKGEKLYNIFCGICHGEKGNGLGYLVAEENPNPVYNAAPKNLLLDEYVNASNGRYYHAIMYGINVMGAYKDKMSYEERWQVIHWVRALQAKDKKLEYSEQANTLDPQVGTPAAQLEALAQSTSDTEAESQAAQPAVQEAEAEYNDEPNH